MVKELEFPRTVHRGSAGPDVRRLQEWLCLNRVFVQIDGVFGPATQRAVRKILGSAEVDASEFLDLASAMVRATNIEAIAGTLQIVPLGDATLAVARLQLSAVPREVGGANRGPWVRLYMDGRDGDQWLWCAGFACWCMERAAEAKGILSLPFASSYSCDTLAHRAREAGLLVVNPDAEARKLITPGSFFLRRKTATDYTHVGIVASVRVAGDAGPEVFETVEGNTNDDGSSNGDGVYSRVRAFGPQYDFIRI